MKNGFTLIELIFTIVILAITTMAIPRMVAQTAELNILAIQQELVANAKTVVVQVSKAPWDSNGLSHNELPRIYDIATDGADVFVPGGIAGKIAVDNKKVNAGVAPTPKANFGSGGTGLFADIDDYADFNRTIVPSSLSAGNTSGDFILNTKVTVAVNYLREPNVNFVNAAVINGVNLDFDAVNIVNTPTNIKLIEITANETNLNKNVILRYYAFNIGTSMPTVR
ncbi:MULTISPECIES: pilus assembly FimT family protein [unclassified Campylobacter]|uniref:pilus assembly FimT family protein n=1 Tax=unclassified Campylobacter TaxID=2593542 RepID=UPI0022EA0D2C|nr:MULTISPECIES: type II secretion system protein [unclassified Campylobacter]MDA3078874.1 prepilin-type N-terminal cleavage/methylation domain-containing protein [Campylobacter sp. CS_NA2]MDA3080835.1 prepilin-type N-terminal cleavage/methylation domain-containing protein [Campylobacter sp. CS_NA1]MDA3084961.1 prepilin-type N-terminal cleavage/methylation domain-containing protein [Campylobacter sp. CS_ED1]MDA3089737.1 prepilin-type N-terminal cleavage/methylation domain-containing protein [Ca